MNIDKLYEPVNYIIDSGGKNIRGVIIRYIQMLLNNENNPLTELIINDASILHNSSLVIDDIQDNSDKRRGVPSAHITYGIPLSINAAYLKCFTALNSIKHKYPKEIMYHIYERSIDACEKSHIGQGLDILWTKERYVPTLDEYLYMADNKTGIAFIKSAEICFETIKIVSRIDNNNSHNLIEEVINVNEKSINLNDISFNDNKLYKIDISNIDINNKEFQLNKITNKIDPIQYKMDAPMDKIDDRAFHMENISEQVKNLKFKINDKLYEIDNSANQLTDQKKQLILDLTTNIGRFFQIRDDYINLTSPHYWQLKGFCEDLDEKKLTYIFVVLNKKNPSDNLYKQLYSKEKLTNEDKIKIYDYLYNNQIFHQTYFDLEVYRKEIINIEQQITNLKEISNQLQLFFNKLEYNLPIEPNKIKKILFINKICQ